jgi:hypothetical protein
MLEERIKVAAVRTYLLSFGLYYSSVSLEQLSVAFELSSKKVEGWEHIWFT